MADAESTVRREPPESDERRVRERGAATVAARISATEHALVLEIPLNADVAALLRGLAPRDVPRLVVLPGASRAHPPGPPAVASEVVLDHAGQTVRRDGTSVLLTAKERDLLAVLLEQRGRVVPRAELLRRVWGYSADVRTRTLDTHISALRRKLERLPGPPPRLVAAHGLGYRWED
jgi:DNA-binding response OmpR family regulator